MDTPPSLITVSTAVAALTPAPASSPSRSLRFSGGAPEDEAPLGSAGRFCPDILRLLEKDRDETRTRTVSFRGFYQMFALCAYVVL